MNKLNIKFSIISLISLISLILGFQIQSANALSYEVYVPLESKNIQSTPPKEEPVKEGEKCSNSFKQLIPDMFTFSYNNGALYYTLNEGNGYDSMESLSTKKFLKLVVVSNLVGITKHIPGNLLFEGTSYGYNLDAGNTVKITFTPVSYELETGVECARGNPVQIFNLTYDEIINLEQ